MTQLLSVGNIMHGRVLESLSEGLVDDFFISCCAVNLSLSCVIRERTACVCVYRSFLSLSLSLSLTLTLTHTHTLSLSLSHTHTLSLSLCVCVVGDMV